MTRAAAIGALATIAGCVGSPDFIRVPTGAHATIVVVSSANAAAIYAFDGANTPATFYSFPRPSDGSVVHVLEYPCALSVFGFPEGELPVAGEGARIPRTPSTMLRAELAGEEDPSFETITELPSAIAELRVAIDPLPTPCTPFTGTPVTIDPDNSGDVTFAVDLGNDRAFLGTPAGHFYIFDSGRITPVTTLSTTTPSRAAFRTTDGDVWLIGKAGRTVHGDPTLGFVSGPSLPAPSMERWFDIDGTRTAKTPLELFLTSGDESFQRFDGTRWSLVDRAMSGGRGEGGSAWIAPGLAVGTGLSDTEVTVYDHGNTRRVAVPINSDIENHVHHVTAHPELGAIVGSSTGELFRSTDLEHWIPLIHFPIVGRIRALQPFRDGFLVAGEGGAITEYRPDYGHCELPTFTTRTIMRIVPFGDRFLVLTDGLDSTTFVLLEPGAAPAACVP